MTDSLRERAAEQLREKLPETPPEELEEALDRAEEYFLGKTQRLQVPARAFWLWVDLALAYWKDLKASGEAQVVSVKRGDTAVTYADESGTPKGMDALSDRLSSYRVVRSV